MNKFYQTFTRYLSVLLVFITSVAWSQSQTITGKVISSDDNSPLPGVSILEKGTSNGTSTDANGTYALTVSSSNATLVLSFIGYKTVEVAVAGKTSLDVTLESDVTALTEVVVIGYGEVKKSDLTGAIASVSSKDFQKGVISSPEQLLQGKAAGVQVTTTSGEPGAAINFRVRGTSSAVAGNNPLFVVDGIPLTGDDVSAGGGDTGRGSSPAKNPLNFINPNDIESMEVLKDASATAIYGSRGANGVVIVKTKSGKGLRKQLEFNSQVSFSTVAKNFDLLNRDAFLKGVAKFGGNAGPVAAGGVDYGADTDWQKEISRTAVSHRQTLSYGDSYKTLNYRASVNYEKQNGVIRHSSMERITGRLNINKSLLSDKLKLGLQSTFSRVNDVAAPITNSAGFEGDLMGAVYMANPTWARFPDSQFSTSNANPNALLKYYVDNTKTDRQLINLSASYDILPSLNFKVNTGLDNSTSSRGNGFSPKLNINNGVYGNGRATISNKDLRSNLFEAYMTYNKKIGEKGNLTALGGYSYQTFTTKGSTYNGFGFSNPNLGSMIGDLRSSVNVLENAIGNQPYQQFGYSPATFFINQILPENKPGVPVNETVVTSVKSVSGNIFNYSDALQSFFGRVNLSLSDKYLLTASLRADGSTKFGPANKYGYFPSGAFAWKLSEENFIPEFFSDLKLRVGYGVTGNQNINHNLYTGRQQFPALPIQNSGDVQVIGSQQSAADNAHLKWEQTSQFNGGFDFGIVQNKLTGTIDLYRKNTSNLLFQLIPAQPSAQSVKFENLPGNVINQGVELTLNYQIVETHDLGVSVSGNVAYNKNKVINLGINTFDVGIIRGQGLTGAFAERIANNQPLNAFFLRDFLGYDAMGNSIYNGDYQKFLGKSPIPKYNTGFTLNVRYKGWDLSSFFTGQFGQYVYNNTANAFFTAGSLGNGRNVTASTVYTGESNTNAPDVSTRFLEKGDFLRFQNLNLGHNFKVEGSAIKSLRLSFSAQNLHVWTKYSGRDPEVSTNMAFPPLNIPSIGIDYSAYPKARTFTIGLIATF